MGSEIEVSKGAIRENIFQPGKVGDGCSVVAFRTAACSHRHFGSTDRRSSVDPDRLGLRQRFKAGEQAAQAGGML